MDIFSDAQRQESPGFLFATVGGVCADGLSLILDGAEGESEKHYRCNADVVFHAGDRVRILSDSGTYVVEYVVGLPKAPEEAAHGIPAGGAAGQVLGKSSTADYDVGWTSVNALPGGGTSGYVLTSTGGSGSQWREKAPKAETADSAASADAVGGVQFRVYGGHLQYKSTSGINWTSVANLSEAGGRNAGDGEDEI